MNYQIPKYNVTLMGIISLLLLLCSFFKSSTLFIPVLWNFHLISSWGQLHENDGGYWVQSFPARFVW